MVFVEIRVVGGGNIAVNDNELATSKLKSSLPKAGDNSLLGKPIYYHPGIRGGLKIEPCKTDETIGLLNATIIAK